MVVWLLCNCCIIDEQLLITYDIRALYSLYNNTRLLTVVQLVHSYL